MDRVNIIYLFFLLAAAIFAAVAYRWYFGHDRSYRRRQAREVLAHEKSMAAKSEETPPI